MKFLNNINSYFFNFQNNFIDYYKIDLIELVHSINISNLVKNTICYKNEIFFDEKYIKNIDINKSNFNTILTQDYNVSFDTYSDNFFINSDLILIFLPKIYLEIMQFNLHYLATFFFMLNFILIDFFFFKVTSMNFWIIPQIILFFSALYTFLNIKTNEINFKIWEYTENSILFAILYQIKLIIIYHSFLSNGIDLAVGYRGAYYLPFQLSYIKLFSFLIILIILYITIYFLKLYYLKTLHLIKPELASLTLFLGFGSGMVFLQNDLFSIFLYLEIISFCVYGFLFLQQRNTSQLHGLIRYVLFSLWMASFYILGISFYLSWTNFNTNLSFFSNTSTLDELNLINITDFNNLATNLNPELALSLLFFLFYFFFKLGVGPFYTWVVDVYNSSSTGVLFVISVIPKLVYTIILGFLLFYNFIKFYYYWSIILFSVGLSTLIISSVSILLTDKLKEIYSWSSIMHTGNILLILSCVSKISLELVFFYLLGYTIISFGFLVIIMSLWNKYTGRFIKTTLELSSINYLSSGFLLVSMIILSSASGFTPLLSFFMKFSLFSLISLNYGVLFAIFIGILNIIGSFAYLKMLWNMIGYNLTNFSNRKRFKPYTPLYIDINYNLSWVINTTCLFICFGFFIYNEFIYNLSLPGKSFYFDLVKK